MPISRAGAVQKAPRRPFVVMPVGSQLSLIGKLTPRDDEGWSNFNGTTSLGQPEGLAMAVAQEAGLRWTLMPLSPDKQGRMPNRIEVEVNLAAMTPPSRAERMRLDQGALISDDDEAGRTRYERAKRD